MKIRIRLLLLLCILMLVPVGSLWSQRLKAAVTPEPGNKYAEIFIHISERSGVHIEPIPLLHEEIARALEEGIVDLAILPDSESSHRGGLMQVPVWGYPIVLISESGYSISERNLYSLRTIGVFVEDEPMLFSEVIDPYSLEPRVQRVRHYDSLVRIMATGRVSAIYLPINEFDRSVMVLNEDRDKFGNPFPMGFKEDFLFLSKRRADKAAPLMDRLIQALEELKDEGVVEELSLIPH